MMKKFFFGGIALILVLGVCGYFYMYKSHRDISEEKPVAILPAKDLQEKFSNNYNQSITDFLNKTIEVTGTVTEVSDSTLVVDEVVFCSLLKGKTDKKLNETISVKGRCLGYDELFEQVKFDQCSIK